MSLGITLEGGQKGGSRLVESNSHNSESIYSPTDTVLETAGQPVAGGRLGREGSEIYWVLTTMPDTVLGKFFLDIISLNFHNNSIILGIL